jgi:hypothetical protein
VIVKVVKVVMMMMILDPQRHRKAEVSDSDVNIDYDDDVDGSSKSDHLRNLEQFLGKSGLTFTPEDPTSISQIVNHFLGNDFHEILVQQSDLYHAQNSDKYKNSKSLAWKDVTITVMKKFLAIIIFMGHAKKDKTGDYWSAQ